ncbi:MAG: carboxypeptidase regulatory-like domain-containing protein [Bryobacterales bacterium]|nr:carboxypeptidase regulatory-like domain-containing protein [Bryobacterales bacterium]
MVLLLLLWQAQPVPPAGSTQLAKIEGRVVHALTGEPVRKAQLTLRKRVREAMPVMSGESTVSDDEGKFRFDRVEPGTYSLYAERTGFLRQEYGARSNSYMGTPITVRPGEAMSSISFKLLPQSVIAGRVVNDEGEPVQQAQVMVIRQSGSGGQGPASAGAATNDIGEFRVANLSPGRYLLRVMPQQGFFGGPPPAPPKSEGGKGRQANVPTYYPGVSDAAAASPVEVTPGQQVTGLSITLQKGWVYRISGKLTAPPAAGQMTRLMLMPRERNPLSISFFGGAGGFVKPDGSFQIDNVQSGSYYVAAMQHDMAGGGRPQVVARTPVDVTDQDVEGVLLQVQAGVDISGSVRVEAKEKTVSTAGMRVALTPAEGIPLNTPNAAVGADGTFQLAGVMPDRYYLAFYGTPENYYVRSAQFGSEDALRSGLQVGGGGKLDIVLAQGGATVHGVVQHEEKPYGGAFVLLAPEPYGPQAISLRKIASSDQNGRFEFKGVAPGEYRLYAWLEPQLPLPSDAEAMKPFESKSVKITAREGGSEQTTLAVIETAR